MSRGQLRARAVSLLLAVFCAGSGCGGSSPTAPSTPTPEIVFSNAAALAAHRPALTALIEQTLATAGEALPVGFLRVRVTADAARSIPGWGMGGYALGPDDIEIVVDPAFPGLADLLTARIPPATAHEVHHAVRIRGPGYGATLLEAMVSEGLADHFAVQLLGAPIAPWSDTFPESDDEIWWARARPLLDSTTYDFDAWFFGIGSDLPRWTGYTLGYRLVRDYMSLNPGTSAASLINTPAEAFRSVVPGS